VVLYRLPQRWILILSTSDHATIISMRYLNLVDKKTGVFRPEEILDSHPLPFPTVRCDIGSNDGNLYAVDKGSGEKVCGFSEGGPIKSSSPAVSGNTVYVGSSDGNLYAVDASSQSSGTQ